jgi:hypothetical protein
MKYFFSALAGIVVGIALGAVCLYYDPLTMRAATPLQGSSWTLRYTVPEDDLIALTHSDRLPLPLKPEGVDTLWEATIRSAALSVLSLHDADAGAAAALATRFSKPSRATDLLLRGAILDDYWLVTVPGSGSVFVYDMNNLWPVLRENVVPVSLLRRPWHGPGEYLTTLGPSGSRGPGLAVGATGRFVGFVGDAAEIYRLNRYSRIHGAEELAGELVLGLAAPAAGSAAAGGAPQAAEK